MFSSYYNLIRFSFKKSAQSIINVFNYSEALIFKYSTVHMLSFYRISKNNLSLVSKDLSSKWGLFFCKNLLLLLIFFG